MTAPVETTSYRCGNCQRPYVTRGEAAGCCVCKCGEPVEPPSKPGAGVLRECRLCAAREQVATTKRSLRAKEDQLKEAKANYEYAEKEWRAALAESKKGKKPSAAGRLRLVGDGE